MGPVWCVKLGRWLSGKELAICMGWSPADWTRRLRWVSPTLLTRMLGNAMHAAAATTAIMVSLACVPKEAMLEATTSWVSCCKICFDFLMSNCSTEAVLNSTKLTPALTGEYLKRLSEEGTDDRQRSKVRKIFTPTKNKCDELAQLFELSTLVPGRRSPSSQSSFALSEPSSSPLQA